MRSDSTEDQAQRRAAKLEKMFQQQQRATEAAVEQKKAGEARDQKTVRLRAMRLAAEAEAAVNAVQTPTKGRKTAAR